MQKVSDPDSIIAERLERAIAVPRNRSFRAARSQRATRRAAVGIEQSSDGRDVPNRRAAWGGLAEHGAFIRRDGSGSHRCLRQHAGAVAHGRVQVKGGSGQRRSGRAIEAGACVSGHRDARGGHWSARGGVAVAAPSLRCCLRLRRLCATRDFGKAVEWFERGGRSPAPTTDAGRALLSTSASRSRQPAKSRARLPSSWNCRQTLIATATCMHASGVCRGSRPEVSRSFRQQDSLGGVFLEAGLITV